MIIDPISDMLTRIRNAIANRTETVELPASKMKEAILGILKQEGLISDFKIKDKKKTAPNVTITLRYDNNQPVIHSLERVSRPGLRIYSPSKDIRRASTGLGIVIVSTPQGVMTGRDARRKGVGGEVICRIW